ADFRDRVGKGAGGNRKNALVILELVDPFAGALDQIGAAIGRAPVDRNETFSPAHAFSANSEKPPQRDFAPRFSFQAARLVRPRRYRPKEIEPSPTSCSRPGSRTATRRSTTARPASTKWRRPAITSAGAR